MDFLWILVLAGMVWAHTWADYVLQHACLHELKCKSWWQEHANQQRYRNDYKVALLMHCIQWTGAVLAPIAAIIIFCYDINTPMIGLLFLAAFVSNTIGHYYLDDAKANRYMTNLIEDQVWHMVQVVITWGVFLAYLEF